MRNNWTISRGLRLTWRSRTGCMGCRRSRSTSRSKIVSLLLSMLETWFLCLTPDFWLWEIIWDHFKKPQIVLKSRMECRSCKRSRTASRSKFISSLLNMQGQSEASGNGPKWFPIPKNMGLDTRIKCLAPSHTKLGFSTLKWSLTSYSPFITFLTFRSIWGFWK